MPRCAVLACACVVAATVTASPVGTLPPAQMSGGVAFRTGGVGELEAAAMRRAEPSYPLSVEFFRRHDGEDEFVADVDVTIADRDGRTLLSARGAGPVLLADLPDGSYMVVARQNGETTRKRVTLAGRPERLVFIWPAA
jgi:hypothetical protein